MRRHITLTVFAFAAGTAAAQIPSDVYRIEPGMLGQVTTASGQLRQESAAAADPLFDAVFDGRPEVVGAPLGAAVDLIASDQLVDNGNGRFTLTLRVESSSTLSPPGLMRNGIALDAPGIRVTGVDFAVPAFVDSAVVTAFGANGSLRSIDIRPIFPGFFVQPGGWPGSLNVYFGVNEPVFAWEVVLEYRTAAGSFVTTGAGCLVLAVSSAVRAAVLAGGCPSGAPAGASGRRVPCGTSGGGSGEPCCRRTLC